MTCGGLCQRRSCLLPTWRGWLVILVCLAALGASLVFGIYPFLAERHPFDTGPVVVEGWANHDTFRAAIEEQRRHGTPLLFVTGGVLEEDLASITHQTSYAALGALRLRTLGQDPASVQAVPAPDVRKDRTFASALALKQWLQAHGGVPPQITVISEGPHARRSRMLFQQAFGKTTEVGILAISDKDEQTRYWWTYSQGFRTVTDETIAYLYATLLFWKTGA